MTQKWKITEKESDAYGGYQLGVSLTFIGILIIAIVSIDHYVLHGMSSSKYDGVVGALVFLGLLGLYLDHEYRGYLQSYHDKRKGNKEAFVMSALFLWLKKPIQIVWCGIASFYVYKVSLTFPDDMIYGYIIIASIWVFLIFSGINEGHIETIYYRIKAQNELINPKTGEICDHEPFLTQRKSKCQRCGANLVEVIEVV